MSDLSKALLSINDTFGEYSVQNSQPKQRFQISFTYNLTLTLRDYLKIGSHYLQQLRRVGFTTSYDLIQVCDKTSSVNSWV
jgi:hypothetical protein